jgi:demethylmenaquinone methyltransferase / 2-methoxy-6-polyprenyl-1,4-benzoquinol methylase
MTLQNPSSPAVVPKAALVQPGSGDMFDAIASRYDLMNRLLSFGVDQRWRKKTVAALALGSGATVLDLATGTADLALRIALTHPDSHVFGVDPSRGMLALGREKVRRAGLEGRITLSEGVGEALPFGDDTFDGVTMAFGIRNVPDRPQALRELSRVTRPGGRVCILELSEPRRGLLAFGARFHMHRVVPLLGALLSGPKAYRYLPRSIAEFPTPAVFCTMMRAAGLEQVHAEALTFGVCQLYVGTAQ